MSVPVEKQIEAIDDLSSHRRAWRDALVKARDQAQFLVPPEDDAEHCYWEHEIRAFDRTFDALIGPADGDVNLLLEMFRNGAAWAIGVRELAGRSPNATEVEKAFFNLLPEEISAAVCNSHEVSDIHRQLRAFCNQEIARLNRIGSSAPDFQTTNGWLKRLDMLWQAIDRKNGRPAEQPDLSQMERENHALREALHDAINRPKGVVPASAEPFYNPLHPVLDRDNRGV